MPLNDDDDDDDDDDYGIIEYFLNNFTMYNQSL